MESSHIFRIQVPGQSDHERLINALKTSADFLGAPYEVTEVIEIRTNSGALVGILNELVGSAKVAHAEHTLAAPALESGPQAAAPALPEPQPAETETGTQTQQTDPGPGKNGGRVEVEPICGDQGANRRAKQKPKAARDPLAMRICAGCKVEFIPRRSDQRYCNTKCHRNHAHGKNAPAQKEPNWPEGTDYFLIDQKGFYTEAGLKRAMLTGRIQRGARLQDRQGNRFVAQVGQGFKLELVPEKVMKISKKS